MAKSKAEQQREKEFLEKVEAAAHAAEEAAKGGGTDSRLGSVTPENLRFVALLVEEMFTKVAPKERRFMIGSMNEILVFLQAAGKRLFPENTEDQEDQDASADQG